MNLVTRPETNGQQTDSATLMRAGPPVIDLSRHHAAMPQGFDLVGPLMRRKYIVILLAIIGSGLGYVVYVNTPPLYESQSRLMIWSQVPPRVVGGEVVSPTASLAKYENLLSSQLVLGKAIEDAKLDTFGALTGDDTPLQMLRDILIIKSDDENDDTLTLSVTGPDAKELPDILNNIFDAFEATMVADSRVDSNESGELIEALKKKLEIQKNTDEKRYLELLKQLGVTSRDDTGDVVNPHAERLQKQTDELAEHEEKLMDVVNRIGVLNKAGESNNADELRVCANLGRQYIGLDRRNLPSISLKRTRSENLELEVDRQTSQRLISLDNQLSQARLRLMDLQIQKSALAARFGPRHEDSVNLDRMIDAYEKQETSIETQISEIRDQWLASNTGENSDEFAERVQEWDKLRDKDESEWLRLYAVALNQDKDRLVRLVEETRSQLSELETKATKIAADVNEVNILRKQIEEKRLAVRVILNKLSGIDILKNNYTKVRARVVDQPGIGVKVAPSLLKSIGLGCFLASFIGCGLAILIDRADNSFRNPNEISRLLNAPVVGRIPRIHTLARGKGDEVSTLVSANQPNSIAAESIRAIRTALFFNSANDNAKLYLFTSPSPGDGKSTTVSNLAISIARTGKKVCLVDCDFRRPRIHRFFGEDSEPGLKGVLDGDITLQEAVRQSSHENLSILTTGGTPPNPGELITMPVMRELLNELTEEFDFVLIDSPPVLPVADPVVLAGLVDAVYIVLRVRKGVILAAQRTRDSLTLVNGNIQGVIVNGVDQNPYYSEYGYSYGYPMHGYDIGRRSEGYGTPDESEKTAKRIAAKTS